MSREYNFDGQYKISNNNVLMAEVLPLDNTGYINDWGVPYFTMKYLLVDYAREQFQVAEAIRTDFRS